MNQNWASRHTVVLVQLGPDAAISLHVPMLHIVFFPSNIKHFFCFSGAMELGGGLCKLFVFISSNASKAVICSYGSVPWTVILDSCGLLLWASVTPLYRSSYADYEIVHAMLYILESYEICYSLNIW